jgi:hypothetical protein
MADGTPDVEDLWNRYAPLVLRRCRQLLRDEQEALDVCQDVFVQLLRRRDTLDIRYPSSLIYRMDEALERFPLVCRSRAKVTPAIRSRRASYRGRAPLRHRADYRRFGRRNKEEVHR